MSQCRQKLKAEGKPYPRSNCAICGQWEACWKECDEKIQASAPPPQSIYDEAKERKLFEAFWKSNMNVEVMDLHRNIYPMNSGWSYACHETNRSWMTWVACAQSRAKAGEDE